jgi:hypothetical protein
VVCMRDHYPGIAEGWHASLAFLQLASRGKSTVRTRGMPRANARTFTVLFKVIETPKMRMVSMSAHRAEDGGRMNHHVTCAAMQTAGFFREILPRINLYLQARLNVRFAGCTVRFCKLHAKRNDWSIDKRWPSDPASSTD